VLNKCDVSPNVTKRSVKTASCTTPKVGFRSGYSRHPVKVAGVTSTAAVKLSTSRVKSLQLNPPRGHKTLRYSIKMASSPVYGKQYIRFAETAEALGTDELPQFRVVKINNAPAGDPPIVELSDGGESMGVLQQTVPTYDEDKATTISRLCTIATSGLLLIESVAAPGGPVQNDALEVNADGIAVAPGSGAAVTVNGTTPIVRQVVTIGGVYHVLVSFN
jgi:hypothetical protein